MDKITQVIFLIQNQALKQDWKTERAMITETLKVISETLTNLHLLSPPPPQPHIAQPPLLLRASGLSHGLSDHPLII